MKDGGLAKKKPKSKKSRGGGSAIKGTKFKGVSQMVANLMGQIAKFFFWRQVWT